MAAAVELATAYITVAASGNDLAPSLGRGFKAVEKIADDSGKRMGRALTGQVAKATEADVEKAKSAYEKAAKRVTSTVETQAIKVENAKRKEEIAQAKVSEAQAKAETALAGVAEAQRRATAAQEEHGRESSQALAAQKKLTDEQARYESGTTRVLSAQDQLALASQKVEAAQRGQESATEKANRELAETEKQLRDTERAAEAAAQPFTTLGDRIKSAMRGDFKGAFKPVEREGQDAADEIERDFKRAGDDSAKGFGSSFKAGFAGALGGLGAYVGIQEVFDWGKYAVSGAADLEQSIGGVETVFKDSAGQMLAWSDAADQTLGLTQNEYNEFAAVLGASMKNAGTPMDELGDKTNWLITAGADLASLYGGTTAEAVDALGSALRGEMDPIERYGISLNAAALDAEGLALGMKKTGGAWSTQEKQLISMSLLQKQSADATGNFAREQETASNVAQRLTAKLKETASELGSRLTPYLADLGGWILDKGIPALEKFGTGVQGIWTLLTTGEFTGAENLFGLEEDSGIVDFLYRVRDAAIWLWEKALQPLGTWISNHWEDIGAFFAGFGGTLVVAGLIALGGAIGGVIASISWIPLAIGAAVGALTWFFTQTEVGKAILAAVVDWMVNTAWPAIQTFAGGVADAAVWLWQNVLAPAWAGIKTAIGATVDWLVNTAWPFIKGVWDAIAGAAVWLWQSVIQPVWTGIKTAIAIAVTAITLYIDLLKWYFNNVIAPVAMWLWNNVMKPVWTGIQIAIGAVVAWFRDTAWPILSNVISWIATKFDQFKLGLSIIWAAVRNNVINPVIAWFRDTAWPIISTVIELIKTGFGVWRDRLKAIWDFVKTSVISPVANWFRDTIGPLFDRITGGIGDAFGLMKDSVKKAWAAVRDTAKVPVEFVVNKIINDAIIGNYNEVASTFGLDPIDDVRLPSGWTRGGILPGQSSWRDGDDQLIAARRGEGMMVSEGLRDSESRSMFLGANHEARTRGTSFADYVRGLAGFAGGGIVLRQPFAGSYPRGDGFGARGGRHKGIDWPMPAGAILKAVAAGTVSHTWNPNAGQKLELSIGDGLVAGYHHLSSYIAGRGASVGAGADVARVGSTGRSSGPHLHFSLKRDGKYVDPMPYLGAGGEAGSGEGGWWNPFTSMWSTLKDKVRAGVGDSLWGDMLFELPKKVIGGAKDWVADKITGLGDIASDTIDTAGGYARWSPVATEALVREGQYGPNRFAALMRRMNQESSYNPRAINNWDSNAAKGQASRGLMQVIPSTFEAYRDRSLSGDIFNPLANIVASIRYTLARYGDLEKGWNRPGGYALGGIVDGGVYDTGGVLDSGSFALNLSGRPEVVLNPSESRAYMAGQASTGRAERAQTIVQVTPPSTADPGIWGRRVAESLDLNELAAVARGAS